MKIHYVVAVYLGPRRLKSVQDPFCHLKKQLKFLHNWNGISKATLVCNKYDPALDKEIPKLIKFYKMPIAMDLIYRENEGGSYAAWETAVIKNLDNNLDYHFLIEDDYVPTTNKFLQPFINTMSQDTAYVCQHANFWEHKYHAAISNGLLSHKLSQNIFQKHKRLFNLTQNGKGYIAFEKNQMNFLDYYTENGYLLKDVSHLCRVPHHCCIFNGFRFGVIGVNKPAVITPDSFYLLHHRLC